MYFFKGKLKRSVAIFLVAVMFFSCLQGNVVAFADSIYGDYVLNASTLEKTTAKLTEEVTYGIFTLLKDIEIDSNGKKGEGGFEFTSRIKLGGAISEFNKGIRIAAPGKGSLKVFALSSSSSENRDLTLYDSSLTSLESYTTLGVAPDGIISPVTYTIPSAGIYYIGGTKAVNIYYMEFIQDNVIEDRILDANTIEIIDDPATEVVETIYNFTSNLEIGHFTLLASEGKGMSIEKMDPIIIGTESFNQRIKLNGSGSTATRAIKFNALAGDKITVYAISGSSSADRTLKLTTENTDTNLVFQAAATGSITTHTVTETADYYLFSPSSGVNILKVVVSSKSEEIVRPDWDTILPPVIVDVTQVDGKAVVIFDALLGSEGADKVTVYMYNKDGKEVTSSSSVKDNFVEIPITESGKYTFKAVASRIGEEIVKESEISAEYDLLLPLAKPVIKAATSSGNGTVTVEWNDVKEATAYSLHYKNITKGGNYITVNNVKSPYVIKGLEVTSTYAIYLTAARGEEKVDGSEEYVTVTEEAKRAWYFAAFGSSTNTTDNTYEIIDDTSVRVKSLNGKGKLVPNSTDGIAYYYTKIDGNKNFTLSADVKVNSWTYSNGQDGFGIMVADRVGTHGDATAFWNNSYMATVTKVEYYYDPATDSISNIGNKITMALGIGAQEKRGVSKRTLEADNPISEFVSTMYPLETSCAKSPAGSYNIIGNSTNTVTGTVDPDNLITELKLEIKRDNTGYRLRYYTPAGNLVSEKLYYDIERQNLTQLDEDYIYLGVYTARNADITFSNIYIEERDPSLDPPAEERPMEKIAPIANMVSTTTMGSSEYEFIFYANADGVLTIKDSKGNIIVDNAIVKAGIYSKHLTTLQQGKNNFTYEFKPNDDYKPSEFVELSSYEKIVNSYVVDYTKLSSDIIYIAPNGSSRGAGTYENPLDIYTAVKYAIAGQTIVLLPGKYNLTSAVVAPRGVNGTKDARINFVAYPHSNERPVLDFGRVSTGITFAGDYWYIKGFDVTNTMDRQKGMQISGDNNIVDDVRTYNNGNTGLQISRYLSTDLFEDWPSNNLILNCTSFNNADAGYEDADGFAAKLTIGEGNVFDGCIAYNNADDGWDLFAKIETGPIGTVVIRNSVAFGNGYLLDGTNAGNGNGFKMGGESITGKHELHNSIAFNNKAKGIDSNSCPDIKVFQATSFNNESYNVAFYTNNAANTDFLANGIISYKTNYKTVGEQLKPVGSQDENKINNATNYYWDSASQTSKNSIGQTVSEDWFVSLDTSTLITRNDDNTINMNGLLELTNLAPEDVGARISGTPSKDFSSLIPKYVARTGSDTSPETSTPTPITEPTKTPEEVIKDEIKNTKVNLSKTKLFVGGSIDKEATVTVTLSSALQKLVSEKNATLLTSIKSSNTKVVAVNGNKIIAKSAGKATVTVTVSVGKEVFTSKVTITVAKANIKFTKAPKTIVEGKKATFTVTVEGYNKKDIQWFTTKKGISIVGKNKGKTSATVTAQNPGKEKILVKVLDGKGKFVTISTNVEVITKITSITYTVKKGDTLSKIANTYNTTVEKLAKDNKITDINSIEVGQKIVIKK